LGSDDNFEAARSAKGQISLPAAVDVRSLKGRVAELACVATAVTFEAKAVKQLEMRLLG